MKNVCLTSSCTTTAGLKSCSFLFALLFFFASPIFAQSAEGAGSDEAAIRQVMADQSAAWNRGNIDDFMKGYWNDDSLMFVGQSGITYGYSNTLNNYKKHYDSQDKMGQLFFTLLTLKPLSPGYYFVIGKWQLQRKAGDVGGIYTLLFRKIKGHWLIIVDHTS